ncbi:MAG: hypothetical protein IJ575_05335 [Selenomonadaceae bacterium]|nr:hypothetical protein [Selenomonadaceae bacterium]
MSRNSGGGGQLFQVKQELFQVFHTQLENLKSLGENIVFGLTGGHDSGVSFHATRKLNSDCFFFTHTRDEDIENASQIAKYYKLNWTSLEGSSIKSNPYYQVFKQSVMSDYVLMTKYHGVIGFLLLNMFPGQWIHIHSVVHEAARGRKWEKARSSLYSLEKFILRMRFANHQKLLRQDPIIVEMAENYFAKLNHAEVARLGYNPWDFSYIETNDGGFLSRYCDDFDPVFESISFANCRRALEIMWQVPDEYINQSSLLYKCIMNEHDFRYREKNMGKDFKPSPKDYDNYALVYGGYLLKGDPIEIAKRALEINPTIDWAKKALQNPNPEKK